MRHSKSQKRTIEKKEQMKDKIIIGIDPASKKHQVEILSSESIPLMRSFPIFNTSEGFKRLNRKLEWVKKTYPSNDIIFAIEPSSHYWLPLFQFFKKQGYKFVLVPGLFVNRSRELEDHTTRKDDPKDAHLIGELASHGKYSYERQPEGVYAELRHLGDSWLELSELKASIRLKLRSILDARFPEFINIFSDFLGTTARYLLKRCPFPVDLLNDDFDELCQQVFEKSRAKLNSSTVIKLRQAAKSSIGYIEGIKAARVRLKQLLERYELCLSQQNEIESEIKIYLAQIDYSPHLISLPGVSSVSVAILLGQAGDLRNYMTVAELISYAGLDLIYSDSGNQQNSRRKISKRGRKKLRYILYQMTLKFKENPNIARRKYLKQRLAGKKPVQAIVSSISFFVRVMFATVKEQRAYEPLPSTSLLLNEIGELEDQLDTKLNKKRNQNQRKKAA